MGKESITKLVEDVWQGKKTTELITTSCLHCGEPVQLLVFHEQNEEEKETKRKATTYPWENSKLAKIPFLKIFYYRSIADRLDDEHKEILDDKSNPDRISQGQVKLDEALEAHFHFADSCLETMVFLVILMIIDHTVL